MGGEGLWVEINGRKWRGERVIGEVNSREVVLTADGRSSDRCGRIPIVAERTYATENPEPNHDFVALSAGG